MSSTDATNADVQPDPTPAAETNLDRSQVEPNRRIETGLSVAASSANLSTEERLDRLEAAVSQGLNLDLGEYDSKANQLLNKKQADEEAANELYDIQRSAEQAGETVPVSPGNIAVVTAADGSSITTWPDGTTAETGPDGEVTKPREQSGETVGTSGLPVDEHPQVAGAEGLPIAGYDDLTIADITPQLDGFQAADLDRISEYEIANQNRVGVLDALERRRAALDAEGQQ